MIPKPPVSARKKYAGLQNTTSSNTNANANSNNSSRVKSLPLTTQSTDGIALQKENFKLPETPRVKSERKTSGPYHSNTQSSDKRQVSNSSLSSSMYPNDLSPITSLKNASNSTLPDFSRQTSSIYPASTFAHENHYNSYLESSGTISKRTDLLRKRKPPPPSLRVKTSDPQLAQPEVQSPSDTMKASAVDSNHLSEYDSTDSEFTPLNLIPPTTIPPSMKSGQLSTGKLLNPSKNVMFVNSTTSYEPPNFHPEDNKHISKNESQEKNVHKHSRTLSSIEEITSALDSFQLEHEKSFMSEDSHGRMETEGDTDGDAAGGTLSFTSSPVSTKERPIALHLTQELYKQDFDYSVRTEDAENGVTDESNAIFLKVKDLPHLENGETLDQYISKLKTTAPDSYRCTNENNSETIRLLDLEKPKSVGGGSENSSASDVFYDVDEPSKDASLDDYIPRASFDEKNREMPEQKSSDVNEEDGHMSITDESEDHPPGEVQSFQPYTSADSSAQGIDDGAESEVLDEYSEEDLIGPLDGSFESFVQDVKSRGTKQDEKDVNGDVAGETQTISTAASNIPEDIEAEDGIWHRYSSATNFFNDADQLHDGKIVGDDEEDNDRDALYGIEHGSTHSESSRSLILTPTDSRPYVNMGINLSNSSPHRDFNLGDELENNVTAIIPEVSSSKSLEALYPTHSSDGINDENDEDDDDEDDDNDDNGSYERYDSQDDDNGSYVVNYERNHMDMGNHISRGDSYEQQYNLKNKDTEVNPSNPTDYSKISRSVKGAVASGGSSLEENDNDDDDDDGVLEFSPRSPRSPRSVDSIEEMAQTPEIFRHNSMCSKSLLEKASAINLTGTPTGLGIGPRQHLVITNQELQPLDGDSLNNRNSDEIERAPIPDLESNFSYESSSHNLPEKDERNDDNDNYQNIYDRREEPTVMPIQHSLVVTPAAPVIGTSSTLKKRRPPPSYPSTGRRGRGLSETTANPEMFANGIAQQLKPQSNDGESSEAISKEFITTNIDPAASSAAEADEAHVSPEQEEAHEELENRKGEKCIYIENLRLRGKKAAINIKPSIQVLPLAIRQNGTISHKKIPSQQLTHSFKSNKHMMAKPKTRMLASEINDGELPDATLIHRGQKTKVPIHPDAAVIAASEQFSKLAKQQVGSSSGGGNLGRFNSVLSVRPHYGNGMRLFITNPDSDDN